MTVALEERAARRQHRTLERAQRASRAALARRWREQLREAVRATRSSNPSCRCHLAGVRTREDLAGLEGGCTMPLFACPRLDAVRRRMGS